MPDCIIVRGEGICVELFWYALSLMSHYKSDQITFMVCSMKVCVSKREPERDQNVLNVSSYTSNATKGWLLLWSGSSPEKHRMMSIMQWFWQFHTLSYHGNQENICGHSINICREVEMKIILNTGYGEAEQAGHHFLFSIVLSEKMLCLGKSHYQGNKVSLSDRALNRAAWLSPILRMKKASAPTSVHLT